MLKIVEELMEHHGTGTSKVVPFHHFQHACTLLSECIE